MRFPIPFFALLACASAHSAVELPHLIGDHMVLQADEPAVLWGKTDPGNRVEAAFLDTSGAVLARMEAQGGPDGRFHAALDKAVPAGVEGALVFKDADGEKTVADVLTGEVWLASGQSNMGFSIGAKFWPASVVETAREEVKRYQGTLRYFNVAREGADSPQEDCNGNWVVVDAASVRFCSAIAWNFAVEVRERTGHPVGIVLSSIGGTQIEAWISPGALEKCAVWPAVSARHEALMKAYPQKREEFEIQQARWESRYPSKNEQDKHAAERPREPYGPSDKNVPGRLFDGMIAPLKFLTMRGVIWYQGENNAGRPEEYPELIRTLITSWRAYFGSELPFYYVELANYKAPQEDPVEQEWTLIREAQAVALELPQTGVACAIDVGQADQIHYWNKKPVGVRLADMALADNYGMAKDFAETRSPQLASFAVKDGAIALKFSHAGKGLRLRPGASAPEGFAICGKDGKWVWAGRVSLEGDTIVVSDVRVAEPAAVRYAWAANPKISVENSAGLPMRPFRTDRNP